MIKIQIAMEKECGISKGKKLYEIGLSAGKLHVEVNAFQRYFFVIVTYASLLKIDGPMQIAHSTPYNKEPSVVDLVPENQSSNQSIARSLCKQLNVPVILSLNIDLQLNKQGQQELSSALAKLCLLHLPQKQEE